MSREELFELACDENVESRLVTATRLVDARGRRVARPYRLKHGPFELDQFPELGKADWTLLVQDVDKFVPKVHALLELVKFLPRWSVDDIMISYAVPGGSVGPHTDRYDVFLLQAEGTRRWQISSNVDDSRLRDDAELRVLSEFEAEEEFVARPGDVLYLPPGVGHFGVAEDECLTFSFGFRAPTEALLVSYFCDEMTAICGDTQLYEELTTPPGAPAQLSSQVLERARAMVRARFLELIENERTIGRYLTSPKPHLQASALHGDFSEDVVRRQIGTGARIFRSIASRFLYSEENGEVVLFVDGEDYSLGSGERSRWLAQALCEASPVFDSPEAPEVEFIDFSLVAELLSQGALFVEE